MSFISKLFGNNDEEFSEVRVDREVLESVIYYSKKAYPNEFLAFFDGEIKDKILYITGLIFVPGETCETASPLPLRYGNCAFHFSTACSVIPGI